MTAARCRETLASVATSLERADQAARIDAVGDELIAADLRCALDQLGSILGVIYTDDVLDRVFSKFCIGK
jgi:tRNA modification GTPase